MIPGLQVRFAISPAIGVLLYATFLGVPFTRLADAFRDAKFLTTLLVLNFVIVPVIVFALVAMLIVLAPIVMGRWRLPGMIGLLLSGLGAMSR